MEFVSRELSQSCGLTLHSNPLYVGGGHFSLGFVFYGKDIEEGNRSPHKFDEFEELLASTGISYTPIPKLEKLCSATYRKYPVEPPEMRRRPRPDDWERRVGHGIFPLLREVREADERCSREEGAVGQTGDHGVRCVLRARSLFSQC